MATNVPVTMDTLITVKVSIQGSNRKFKIPLRDLGPHVLPDKLRFLLAIPQNQKVVFERFSDSAGAYITLDSDNVQVYKTLYRAAKAKLKLRIRATVDPSPPDHRTPSAQPAEPPSPAAPEPQASSSRPHSIAAIPPPPLPPQIRTHGLTPIIAAQWSRGRLPETSVGTEQKRKTVCIADGSRDEAPAPRPFQASEHLFSELARATRERELALRLKEPPAPSQPACSWSIYCNECDKPMANEHYHCSICDDNDYDLCKTCVDAGIHCPGDGHWLVKRFVRNGQVVCSTTERIAPKPRPQLPRVNEETILKEIREKCAEKESKEEPAEKEMPGAFTEERKAEQERAPEHPTRTCNSCVKIFPEEEFVTCIDCDDYDLCIPCHVGRKHGHHPGHAFKPATDETDIGPLAEYMLPPGRNIHHAAICDGCDENIYGVRHKCLDCPDWDYCSECIKNAKFIHPQHRFAPIYENIGARKGFVARHVGIFCDGPLCTAKTSQTYIQGVRYKCAVCHDTDFCATCEAHPTNKHNRTHPLIMFKTPVRNVSVTTMHEDKGGSGMVTVGDQPLRRGSVPPPPPPVANAATQVQTIVDLKPTEDASPKPPKEKIEIKDLLAEPIEEKIAVKDLLTNPEPEPAKAEEAAKVEPPKVDVAQKPAPTSELDAHFVRDTVADGTKVLPDQRFIQVWTLRNPGPHAWPAGCSVRYVGGDNMLNVDHSHPSTATDIAEATESNVVGRTVEVGEEIAFRILMKAPKREGVAISYWRLKAADGTPFGHRLWCHIDVTSKLAPPASASSSPPHPPTVASPPATEVGSPKPHEQLSNYQLQLALLDQICKKRGLQKRQEEQAAEEHREAEKAKEEVAKAAKAAAQARQEGLRKLMGRLSPNENEIQRLLEQQNQRRLMMMERESMQPRSPSAGPSAPIPIPVTGPEPVRETRQTPSAEKEVVSMDDVPESKEEISSTKSEASSSTMIFPRLEKESPVSSTHEAVTAPQSVASPSPSLKAETAASSSPKSETTGFFEDAESVEILDADAESDDEGFATDEEYDILDASDEELA